jgi:hypothetical protein
MTALGVFRDDFYNAVSALAQSQVNATTLASGSVLPAFLIAGAGDCYINASGGAAVSYTTDSAINIIAQIQNAVATAYKQGLGSFAAGVNPPNGAPNLFNTTWSLEINNQNSGSITLTGGTGVTLIGTNAGTIVTATARQYVVTITSPTTVTIQSVGAFLASAP